MSNDSGPGGLKRKWDNPVDMPVNPPTQIVQKPPPEANAFQIPGSDLDNGNTMNMPASGSHVDDVGTHFSIGEQSEAWYNEPRMKVNPPRRGETAK